jgi:hypothetical protein
MVNIPIQRNPGRWTPIADITLVIEPASITMAFFLRDPHAIPPEHPRRRLLIAIAGIMALRGQAPLAPASGKYPEADPTL